MRIDGALSMDLPTILHLEDSDLDAHLIRERLLRNRVVREVVRAMDREDFLTHLTSDRHFDLILSDYQLVSFDGMAALELVRRHRPNTPFVFVSGTLGEEVAINTLQRGATDYVLKHRLERLIPAVERALAEA